ncbi:MAG TPA: aldehyde dehydrogenase (NADP(+)) [Candidatus Acidoferrales bacterium]|nr:aldehyde dehydrogenase (NADP(+)) [Candidatus Acidoferrales bacterium]
MGLNGRSILGNELGKTGGRIFRAINPATGQELEPNYYSADAKEVDSAARMAASAFLEYSAVSGKTKGALLRKIAEQIDGLGDDLVNRAVQETALPPARIKNETARTSFQLRLFAEVVEEGSWVNARIDRGNPGRKPAPKPDVRSLWRALGPVAVFCASNFPIAFSVAGGDTASALAAGNPAVVRAHAAHPGTAEMVGQVIQRAVKESGLPEGIFSLLFDAGTEGGLALVNHAAIKAVGFTGSRNGGRALMGAAAARPEPIPVFAEMSSTNPVFILPGAMKERGAEIAKGVHASVTLGAGQFCTKPGVVVVGNDASAREFATSVREMMKASGEFTLLTSRIHEAYRAGVEARSREDKVRQAPRAGEDATANGFRVNTALFETDAPAFIENEDLQSEIFGPSTLIVHHDSRDELLAIARGLEGHLTATLHGTENDLREFADLVAILETKVGRLIFNGYPTGVEVCHAMVHGGPYPATSDGRSTSVGTQAIYRFARPVCYQDFPNTALPDELKNENSLGIWRLVDGQMTRDKLTATAGVRSA